MSPPPRNYAIDLGRSVAAFGVIAIHCAPGTAAAEGIGGFFVHVCVPFFLLTALFLYWEECRRTQDATAALRRRLPRLLLPYFAWTLIYVGARMMKALLQCGSLGDLFKPASLVAIVGSGGGAVQLYFLPLLAIALILAWGAAAISRRGASAVWLAGAFLLTATTLFQTLENLAAAATNPMAKLGYTYLDWAIWMLPFVAGAGLIATARSRLAVAPIVTGWTLLIVAAAFDLVIVLRLVIPQGRWHSLVLAALVLGACLVLGAGSAHLARWKAILGASFGVFLSHHLFLEAAELIDSRLGGRLTQPYSAASLILVAVAVFAASTAFTLAVQKRPRLARVLLGQ